MKSDRRRFFAKYAADLETLCYEARLDRYTLLTLSRGRPIHVSLNRNATCKSLNFFGFSLLHFNSFGCHQPECPITTISSLGCISKKQQKKHYRGTSQFPLCLLSFNSRNNTLNTTLSMSAIGSLDLTQGLARL